MRVPLKLQYSRTKLKLYLSFVQPFPYEPGGREFDNGKVVFAHLFHEGIPLDIVCANEG